MDRQAAGRRAVLALAVCLRKEIGAVFGRHGEVGLVRRHLRLVARIEAVAAAGGRRVEVPARGAQSRQCTGRWGLLSRTGEIRRNDRAGASASHEGHHARP